jgi:transposase, IS5 family
MKQTTFASAAWDRNGKVTRRERFLGEMDAVIPWSPIKAIIEPHYPKAGNGTQPMPMERMLRIYFMQQWFNLSDPGAEDALYDSESMRRFAGIELVDDAVPDESTILRLRHVLEQHKLTEQIFGQGEASWSRSGCCSSPGRSSMRRSSRRRARRRTPLGHATPRCARRGSDPL